MKHSAPTLLLAALPLALCASSARADGDAPGHQADLFFGPLIGGEDMVLDVRSTEANAPVLAFFGFGFQPTVPANPAYPVVGVSPPNTFLVGTTSAAGRFRVELPTVPGQFPSGTGLVMRMQAVLLTQDGDWAASRVKATALQPPSIPSTGMYADESAARLPAGFDQLGAIEASAVDVNRDGHVDLTLITPNDVVQWNNDGAGNFVDAGLVVPHPGDALGALANGDVNGDGAPDLITAGGYDDFVSPPDRLYTNDGTGVFTSVPSFPGGLGATFDLELGDVDNDGDLDVVMGVQPDLHLVVTGGKDQLYRNDGLGGFTVDAAFAAMAWNEDMTDTRGIELGDVDSDGDLDVFVAKSDTLATIFSSGEPNRLLLGDGTGAFVDATLTNLPVVGTDGDNSQDVELADVDGDGDLDVIVANSVFAVTTAESGDVLVNLGGDQGGPEGVFVDNPVSFLEPSTLDNIIRMSVNAADLDADGDLDVLVTVHDGFVSGTQQLLFINDGFAQGGSEGFFTQDSAFDPADAIISGAALLDIEGDGDVDLLLPVNGVISGSPAQEFRTRLMVNQTL